MAAGVILRLQVGVRVVLPSGNVIVLLARDHSTWRCEYTRTSRLRGEVEFSAQYLRRFGRVV